MDETKGFQSTIRTIYSRTEEVMVGRHRNKAKEQKEHNSAVVEHPKQQRDIATNTNGSTIGQTSFDVPPFSAWCNGSESAVGTSYGRGSRCEFP